MFHDWLLLIQTEFRGSLLEEASRTTVLSPRPQLN